MLAWREVHLELPPREELQGLSKMVHNLCVHWDVLEVQDGVLYHC